MKFFKTKHEEHSALITLLLMFILVFLVFIVGLKYLDPPEEYGVAINFGVSEKGQGTLQPKMSKFQPKELDEPPSENQQSITQNSKNNEVNQEKLLVTDQAKAIAINKEKIKKATEKLRLEKEAERLKHNLKLQQEKKKNLDQLIGGIANNNSNSPGEGNDNMLGDKGQLNGDPYAPSYFGEAGLGKGGNGYGLKGRGQPTKKIFTPDCDEEGIVVVQIEVNKNGNVYNASPGKKGTTGPLCLYDAARKTAMTYKWPANDKAPSKQIGFVVINFSVTQ